MGRLRTTSYQTPEQRRWETIKLMQETTATLHKIINFFRQEQMHGYLDKVINAHTDVHDCLVNYTRYHEHLKDNKR